MGKAGLVLLLALGQFATAAGAVMAGLFAARTAGDAGLVSVVAALALAALVPALLLPLFASLSPRQAALRWASIYLVAVSLVFLAWQGPWLLWWTLAAPGLALALPLRAALVAAAAREVHVSAARLMTLGVALSLAAVHLGLSVTDDLMAIEGPGLPLAFGYASALFALGLATTLAPPFSADAERPALPDGWRPLFEQLREARSFRWALFWGGLFRGAAAAFLAWAILHADDAANSSQALRGFFLNASLGALITAIQGHPRRVLGIIPPALTALAIGLVAMTYWGPPISWFGFLGWMIGMLLAALHNALGMELTVAERFPAELLRRAADVAGTACMGALLYGASRVLEPGQLTLALGLGALTLAIRTWWHRRREVAENVVELALQPFYRIQTFGPGWEEMPPRGPVIVVANHACWFDPLFLGKVLPRKARPMMTSVFFDLPTLRWIMVNLGEAVRVEASGFRREAPELNDALSVLDGGDPLVVFAEGFMRRREQSILRRFGRGIVYLLRERPQTPIVPCWIEGNWGSYASYWNGPPTKNKRMDLRRSIRVAIGAPIRLDPALLDDHLAARQHLMRVVLQTRAHLGLEVPAIDAAGDEED